MKRILSAILLAALLVSAWGCSGIENKETSVPEQTQAVLPSEPETIPEETEEVAVMETQPQLLKDPKDTDFVRIKDYIPDVLEDLKYATAENFTGAVIYNFEDVYLRYGSVKKLMAVQEELRTMGLGIKIWDGFRPFTAQFKLWEICPDDTYVANPNVGFSNHSRGNAVDLTLVDSQGRELQMPTLFDDFSGRADRNYAEIDPLPRENAQLLESVMHKHGFKGYYGEWWHYNDTDRYEPEKVFDPGVIAAWKISPGEEMPLLQQADTTAQVLQMLSADTVVTVLGYDGEYALAEYQGVRGYVTCVRLIPD